MKKVILIALFTLTFCNVLFGQIYDVRKVKWGYSLMQVIKAEGRKPDNINVNKILYLNVKLGLRVANLIYEFNKGKLVSTAYLILSPLYTDEDRQEAYVALKGSLTEKYGTPEFSRSKFDMPEFDGASVEDHSSTLFIATGHGKGSTRWQYGRNQIDLNIFGKNGNVYVTIFYHDPQSVNVSGKSEDYDNL